MFYYKLEIIPEYFFSIFRKKNDHKMENIYFLLYLIFLIYNYRIFNYG
jgi:hypothetical protein